MSVDQRADAVLGTAVEPRPGIRLDLVQSAGKAITIGELWQRPLTDNWTASVHLDGVRVKGAANGFRVFMNKPDASSTTSIEDEHYVGSYAFFPLPEGNADNGEDVGSFMIPLKNALMEQRTLSDADPPEDLIVTIIPLGGAGTQIGFAKATLQID